MKKILLSLFLLFCVCANARDLSMKMIMSNLSANALLTNDNQNVSISQNLDGTYNFVLPNLILDDNEGNTLPIGTISLNNMIATTDGDVEYVNHFQNLTIENGTYQLDDDEMWIGPTFGIMPCWFHMTTNGHSYYITITYNFERQLPDNFVQNVYTIINLSYVPNKFDVNADDYVNQGDVNALLNYILANM